MNGNAIFHLGGSAQAAAAASRSRAPHALPPWKGAKAQTGTTDEPLPNGFNYCALAADMMIAGSKPTDLEAYTIKSTEGQRKKRTPPPPPQRKAGGTISFSTEIRGERQRHISNIFGERPERRNPWEIKHCQQMWAQRQESPNPAKRQSQREGQDESKTQREGSWKRKRHARAQTGTKDEKRTT